MNARCIPASFVDKHRIFRPQESAVRQAEIAVYAAERYFLGNNRHHATDWFLWLTTGLVRRFTLSAIRGRRLGPFRSAGIETIPAREPGEWRQRVESRGHGRTYLLGRSCEGTRLPWARAEGGGIYINPGWRTQ